MGSYGLKHLKTPTLPSKILKKTWNNEIVIERSNRGFLQWHGKQLSESVVCFLSYESQDEDIPDASNKNTAFLQ